MFWDLVLDYNFKYSILKCTFTINLKREKIQVVYVYIKKKKSLHHWLTNNVKRSIQIWWIDAVREKRQTAWESTFWIYEISEDYTQQTKNDGATDKSFYMHIICIIPARIRRRHFQSMSQDDMEENINVGQAENFGKQEAYWKAEAVTKQKWMPI